MTENWNRRFESDEFIVWCYNDSPYRVVAFPSSTGHWKVYFTSVYGTQSVLVRGNLGSSPTGKMKSKAVAKQFFEKFPYGCPPPSEITDYKI